MSPNHRRRAPGGEDGQLTLAVAAAERLTAPDVGRPGRVVLRGEVLAIWGADDDGSWVTGVVRPDGTEHRVPFVGAELPRIEVGREVSFSGLWEEHPEHGPQFRVQEARTSLPSRREAVLRYIATNVRGCGEARATRIVEAFGETCLDALQRKPARVADLFAGQPKVAEDLASAWAEWAVEQARESRARALALRLMEAGLTYGMARRVQRFFRSAEVADIVALRRPYRLLDVPGIGWATADCVARTLGMAADHPDRIQAALLHRLTAAMENGHSAVPRARLVARTKALVGAVADEPVMRAIEGAEEEGALVQDGELVMLPAVVRTEWTIADQMEALRRAAPSLSERERTVARGIIEEAELEPEKVGAVWNALECGVSVLTGGPGCGKTTTVLVIARCCHALGWTIQIAAPTGKAAARAAEVTRLRAVTVHRLIGGVPGQLRDDPLRFDLLVVDEVSMLDAETFAWLLSNLAPATRVLLVGDEDQLPSVGHGRVLADVIECGRVPVARLTKPWRQKEDSRILSNARALLRGEPMVLADPASDFVFVNVTEERPDASVERARGRLLDALGWLERDRGAIPVTDVQVLTPMRRGALGVAALNALLQATLNPAGRAGPAIGAGARVRVGDRVMQVRNDYNARGPGQGLFNGEQGVVLEVGTWPGEWVAVRFDEDVLTLSGVQLYNLQLAWAITVHRSQGSEWSHVVLLYHSSHAAMPDRSLLYTAITRAKKQLVLIGDRAALGSTRPRLERRTGLARQLAAALCAGTTQRMRSMHDRADGQDVSTRSRPPLGGARVGGREDLRGR